MSLFTDVGFCENLTQMRVVVCGCVSDEFRMCSHVCDRNRFCLCMFELEQNARIAVNVRGPVPGFL